LPRKVDENSSELVIKLAIELGPLMLSMMIWVLALAGSIAAICMTVAMNAHDAHIGAMALITLGLIAAAISEHRSAEIEGASSYKLAASGARYLGLLWAWSTIATYVVYAFILEWAQWVPTVMAMLVGCVMCLFVARVLDREDDSATPDSRSLALATWLARSQFAFGAVILGMVTAVKSQAVHSFDNAHNWVAVNIAMCTAVGILMLTGYLMLQNNQQPTETPAAA
jgi:hypothetical protein